MNFINLRINMHGVGYEILNLEGHSNVVSRIPLESTSVVNELLVSHWNFGPREI